MRADISKKRFIEEARNIIDNEGVGSLTIRRLGREMNCNTGNIYYYFKNLYELVTYASLRFISEYFNELSTVISERERTANLYEEASLIYGRHAFQHPEIFNNVFFGPYSSHFGKIAKQYYELFPEEFSTLTPRIAKMLIDEDFSSNSNNLILQEFVDSEVISVDDAAVLSSVIIRYNRGILDELTKIENANMNKENIWENYKKDIHTLITKFMKSNW